MAAELSELILSFIVLFQIFWKLFISIQKRHIWSFLQRLYHIVIKLLILDFQISIWGMLTQGSNSLITETVNKVISVDFNYLRLIRNQILIRGVKIIKRASLLDLNSLFSKLVVSLPQLDFLVINVFIEFINLHTVRKLGNPLRLRVISNFFPIIMCRRFLVWADSVQLHRERTNRLLEWVNHGFLFYLLCLECSYRLRHLSYLDGIILLLFSHLCHQIFHLLILGLVEVFLVLSF